MPQILDDLAQVADPGPRNAFMLNRVCHRIKYRLHLPDSLRTIAAEIKTHCIVTDSPSGPVLRGWCLK